MPCSRHAFAPASMNEKPLALSIACSVTQAGVSPLKPQERLSAKVP
jgi:hypothetical protein